MDETTVSFPRNSRLPGDIAIWVFILAELLVFGVFFGAYAFTRARHVALFNTQQMQLDRTSGAINTVLLITASYCVARAVLQARSSNIGASAKSISLWLFGGGCCGLGFVVIKLKEYHHMMGEEGVSLSSSLFHMFYLSLTFFHFMHVLLGLVILGALAWYARKGTYHAGNLNGLESGAAYWHMVDLVWIILFPLVYVIR